ncbi:MAG: Rieske 2Fe-2S domain-containing protein [Actinomycetota bacterium]
MLAISAWNWVAIGFGVAVGLAGAGLIMVNLNAIMRAKREGPKSHRPLIGPPRQMNRRGFFGRILGLGFGVALLDFGALSIAMLWTTPKGGFGGKVVVPTGLADIKAAMTSSRGPFYYAPGRFYLVPYAGDGADTLYKGGLVAGGMMALYQRCVHLGCKVPFCVTSQWFECPCHGSKYNKAGEYKLGPAPRGLDRFPLTVDGDTVTVDTVFVVTGPPRGTNTTGQEREGAFCAEVRQQTEHK